MKKIAILLLAILLIACCFSFVGCVKRTTNFIDQYITHHEIINTKGDGSFDVRFYFQSYEIELKDVRDILVVTFDDQKFSAKTYSGRNYFDIQNLEAEMRTYFESSYTGYYDVIAAIPDIEEEDASNPDGDQSDTESDSPKEEQPIGVVIVLGIIMVILSAVIYWLAVGQFESAPMARIPLIVDFLLTFGSYLAFGVTCGIIMTVFFVITVIVIGVINNVCLDYNDIF